VGLADVGLAVVVDCLAVCGLVSFFEITEAFKKLALPPVFSGVAAYFFSSSSFFFCVNVDLVETAGFATTDFEPTPFVDITLAVPGRAVPGIGLALKGACFVTVAAFTPALTELSFPGYPDSEVYRTYNYSFNETILLSISSSTFFLITRSAYFLTYSFCPSESF
jgi:hypothetical protein